MITYMIHKIPKDGGFCLALSVKDSTGCLAADQRGLLPIQDKKIAEALIKDFNAYKTLKMNSLEYGRFDRVPISDRQTSFFFTELAKVKQVSFEAKKVVIDALSYCKLFFDVFSVGDELVIEAFIIDGTQKYSLVEMDSYFGQQVVWVLHRGVLKRLKQDFKWLKLALEHSSITGKKKEDLLDHYHNQLPIDPCVPEARFQSASRAVLSPVPVVILKDERGLFFTLQFEYPQKGVFVFLDPYNSDLNEADERFWEEVLRSEGARKIGSEYFVSALDQEKIFKSLIQQGFLLCTHKNKRVVLLDTASGAIKDNKGTASLELKLQFGLYQATLEALGHAAATKIPFVSLDQGAVGLIGFSMVEELGVLLKGSLCGQMCQIPSYKKGDYQFKTVKIEEASDIELSSMRFDHFNLTLLEFQKIGVGWLLSHLSKHHGCLLADDMGLGKTIQILALIDLMKEHLGSGVLIICPKSIKMQWLQAINNYLGSIPVRLDVVTFHELRNRQIPFYSLVVMDEAQAIKNSKTQLFTKATLLQSDYKVALTGTPIENALSDLISIFQFLYPVLTLDLNTGAASELSIKRRLSPFILRRTKKEVLKDLPPLLEQTLGVEMDEAQAVFYFNLVQKAKHEPEHMFALLTKLRLAAVDPRLVDESIKQVSSKTWQIREDIQSIVLSNQKVILFSQFTSYLALMKEHLEELGIDYAYLDGQTVHRDAAIEEFRGDKQVLLMSLKAGGVGLNLQMADYVLIADPWWNQAAEAQAIDRAYRMGREGAVIAKRYVTLGTLEEKIQELKASKWALLDQMASGSTHSIHELLQEILGNQA